MMREILFVVSALHIQNTLGRATECYRAGFTGKQGRGQGDSINPTSPTNPKIEEMTCVVKNVAKTGIGLQYPMSS